jgi:hypothetical protein
MARHAVRIGEELSLDALLADLACQVRKPADANGLRERAKQGSLPITHKWMINFIYA